MLGVPIISSFNDKGVRQAQKAFSSLKDSSDKMSKAFKIGAATAAAGLATAAYAAYDFAKAAMEDEAASAELARSLKATTGATDDQVKSVEKWITSLSLATGTADSDLRPALATISRSTKDVTKAQKLLTTAQNISAATGKPLAATSKAVAQAYSGQFGALKKLSPETAKLIQDGATAEKVFASLDSTFKDAAATAADTTAGKFQRFSVAVDELKEGIGASLLPAMSALSGFAVNNLIPAFQSFQDSIDQNGLMATLSSYFSRGWEWITSTGLPMLGEKLGQLGSALTGWIAPRIVPFLSSLGDFIGKAANWLIDSGLPMMVEKLQQMGQAFVSWIGPNIVPMLTELGKMLANIGIWIITKAVPKLLKLGLSLAGSLIGWVFDLAPKLVLGLGSAIWAMVKALPKLGVKLLKGFVDLAKGVGKSLANGAIGGMNWLIDALNDLLEFTISLPLGKKFTVNPPDLPHVPYLAEGGIVTSPTLAVIGEAGSEAVIPLSKMGNMGGNTFVIQTGVGDPIAIGREIERIMQRYQRRTGVAA